jgi:signal transduction histidine kinase
MATQGTAGGTVVTVAMTIIASILVWLSTVTASIQGSPLDVVREVAPAWAFFLAGFVAWRRRHHNRIGLLMAVIGVSLLLFGLRSLSIPALVSLGLWMSLGPGVSGYLLGVLALAYPSGRIDSRLDGAWVAIGMLWLFSVQLALALATPVGFWGCETCVPWEVVWYSEGIRVMLQNLSISIFAVLAAVLVLLLIRRWMKASPPARRVLAPVWLAGATVPAVALTRALVDSTTEQVVAIQAPIPFIGAFLRGRVPPLVWEYLPWAVAASLLLLPLALLWGLLRAHLGQAAVSALAIELRQAKQRRPVVESLRRALGDRSLDLMLWSRPAAGFVTPDGLAAQLPMEDSGRAITRLDGEDGPLAALVHDPFVSEQRSLVDGVAAVAQLALENERLQAEVRAQLEEVRGSRERIVQAADEERRRVERDIHDGAQQRLVSLSLALNLARARAAKSSPETVETIVAAETELKQAIGELRELARGIHPGILTEAGLGPALESLAHRCPVPVSIDTNLSDRLPPHVETTAYFVVAEALTNVAKHASASAVRLTATVSDGWLLLTVADDGNGGADPARGSGLRGMLDRVAALGGRLSVEAGETGGTRVTAALPCA